jgi:hypothetical protein
MFPDGGGPGYPLCIWYLSDSKQLSPTARPIITTEEKNGESIFVSAISLVEVIDLAERGRLPLTALQSLENALGDPMGGMVICAIGCRSGRGCPEDIPHYRPRPAGSDYRRNRRAFER